MFFWLSKIEGMQGRSAVLGVSLIQNWLMGRFFIGLLSWGLEMSSFGVAAAGHPSGAVLGSRIES